MNLSIKQLKPTSLIKILIRILSLSLIIAAILYINWTHNQATRRIQSGTLIIMPIINDSAHHFNMADLDFLDHEFEIELERVHVGMVENEMRNGFAHVSETGENYMHFTYMDFRYGGSWRDEDSIIISEGMAWELFGHLDAVSLPLRLNGVLYTISGITKHRENFAWILRATDSSIADSEANIMYIRREPYNWILSYAGALELLESLNRRVENYTITSVNFYLRSIELRSLILIFLTLGIFLAFSIRHALKLPNYREQVIIVAIVIILFIWGAGRLNIDLWLPAHAGSGWEAYMQLLFNTGMLAPKQYLPGHLVEIYDMNFRAALAFGAGGIGVLGLFNIVIDDNI